MQYATNPSNPSAVHYTNDVCNVEFENEAVYASFVQLDKALAEERLWGDDAERIGYNAHINFAVVTQEWLDNMNDGDLCKRNEDGTWYVKNIGWSATDLWDAISDGAADE
jgi:hypothetical protein